jgi:hypothetical protein
VATDDLLIDDDPATIAEAVRALAADLNRVLTRAAAGEAGRHDEALRDVQRRAGDLLSRVGEVRAGEGQLYGLRRWLQALQRRVFVMQWLGDSLQERPEPRRCRPAQGRLLLAEA